MVDRLTLPEDTFLDGSYRIVRVVGAGGFGITYEAFDIKLGTQVAIKEYFPIDFGDRDASQTVRPKSGAATQMFEWGRDNFLTEARTLASFDHSSIVRVFRVFEANATAYMVMRFEKGLSFEAWLKSLERPPSQRELDAIARPLLDALETLHGVDYLHRDIAPDNIIIRADGTPVLLDFGSARHVVAEKSRAITGIVKAGYSPQEQYASDNRHQGPWTDIYALGGTLYRAVTGRRPLESMLRFDENASEAAAVIAKGKYRAPFLEAIDKSLAMRPADRHQSVKTFREQLFAPEPTPTVIIPREALPAQTPPPQAQPTPTPPPRPKWPAELLDNPKVRQVALAALVVASGAGWLAIAYQLRVFPMTLIAGPAAVATPDEASVRVAAAQRLAEQEAERARVEAERKKAADAEAARQKAEAEKKRLAELEAERQRVEAERKKAADAEAARQKADAEKKRLAEIEAERQRADAERKKAADAEAALLKAEAEKKRLAELDAERLKTDTTTSPVSRQDGGRQTSLDRRTPGLDSGAEEFLAAYRELLRSQQCNVGTLTLAQLEKSVPFYVEAVNKARRPPLEKIDLLTASREDTNGWLEKAFASKGTSCPFDPLAGALPAARIAPQPVQKAPPVYRPTPPPARAPQAPSQRPIMGIQ